MVLISFIVLAALSLLVGAADITGVVHKTQPSNLCTTILVTDSYIHPGKLSKII